MMFPAIYAALLPVKAYVEAAFRAGLAIYPHSDAQFSAKVLAWVDALFREIPDDDPDEQHLQTWSWQMAICMAIDLRSHTKKVSDYLAILETLPFNRLSTPSLSKAVADLPHFLFVEAVRDKTKPTDWRSLHVSSHFDEVAAPPTQYVRVMAIADYLKYTIHDHYFDPDELNRKLALKAYIDPAEFEDWQLDVEAYLNLPNENTPLAILTSNSIAEPARFDGAPPFYFNWVLPYAEFLAFMMAGTVDPRGDTPADIALIATGRPLLPAKPVAENWLKRFQVYVVLPPNHSPPAFQPWAGVSDWSFFPYLSYLRSDGYGRAFNLRTGTSAPNSDLVARERLFEPTGLPEGSFAYLLLHLPKSHTCEREPVLAEALIRFHEAQLLPLAPFIT